MPKICFHMFLIYVKNLLQFTKPITKQCMPVLSLSLIHYSRCTFVVICKCGQKQLRKHVLVLAFLCTCNLCIEVPIPMVMPKPQSQCSMHIIILQYFRRDKTTILKFCAEKCMNNNRPIMLGLTYYFAEIVVTQNQMSVQCVCVCVCRSGK